MTRLLLATSAVLALLLGLQTWRLDRVKADLTTAKAEIAALSEFRRLAIADAQTQAEQCQARVDDARASARRIETIIEREVPRDPNGCPYRPLLSGDELRQALQPNASSAEPLR